MPDGEQCRLFQCNWGLNGRNAYERKPTLLTLNVHFRPNVVAMHISRVSPALLFAGAGSTPDLTGPRANAVI
jgi:hypothetical protein